MVVYKIETQKGEVKCGMIQKELQWLETINVLNMALEGVKDEASLIKGRFEEIGKTMNDLSPIIEDLQAKLYQIGDMLKALEIRIKKEAKKKP